VTGFLLKARWRISCSSAVFSNPARCFAVPPLWLMQLFKHCVANQVFDMVCTEKSSCCFAGEGILTQVVLAFQHIGHYLKRSHKHKAAINNSTSISKKEKITFTLSQK